MYTYTYICVSIWLSICTCRFYRFACTRIRKCVCMVSVFVTSVFGAIFCCRVHSCSHSCKHVNMSTDADMYTKLYYMYIYIYIYIYTHRHMLTYTQEHTYTHMSSSSHTYIHSDGDAERFWCASIEFVHIHTYIHTYTVMAMRSDCGVHASNLFRYKHTFIHTYIHT
jgi:hypothetical protein